MFYTKNGLSFDGDKWENFCQVCFKLKYIDEGYQAMPADVKGDLGIEGFTRTGKVFQCYCPDTNANHLKLYDDQRDKMSRDLSKIEKNKSTLPLYLGDIKIKEWIFVTPEYTNKDLIKHCQTKKEELREKGLSILSDEFDVLVYDIEFFAKEIPVIYNYNNAKLNIASDRNLVDNLYHDWRSQEIELVQNSIRKQGKRFPLNTDNITEKTNRLTNSDIKAYLNGMLITRNWNQINQEQYEAFLQMVGIIEQQVEDLCLFAPKNNDYNERYREIQEIVDVKIRSCFPTLDERTIMQLCSFVVADWILRCPINFE